MQELHIYSDLKIENHKLRFKFDQLLGKNFLQRNRSGELTSVRYLEFSKSAIRGRTICKDHH
jgi:hypothetical protein